ncbi:alpha-glucosidase [Ruminococcaceae bacterium OttesenSCG-928-I18]|nr:alpha-glucosidase [Ruminococcaceae bacterium OttesenSCG-928-I18]
MEKAWWKEAVVYQVYPRSFLDTNGDGVGDLPGVIEKLDYIKELGADVLWLNPIYKSPNYDNGYDISDYKDIMDEFGTMADFDRLLSEAHKRGIKILMDLVVNHTSSEHAWFVESRKSTDNPYREYYIWKKGKPAGGVPNNWESYFSGPAWSYDKNTDMYYLHLFEEHQPDLNWENEQMRKEVYEMMRWWFDKGIDGFRMDTINMLSKTPGLPDGEPIAGTVYGNRIPHMINGPRIHEYLQEMNREVLSKYDVMTVGETPDITTEDGKLYTGADRHELHMVFQFEHMFVDFVDGEKFSVAPLDLVKLKQIMSRWQVELNGVGWNSLYWDNHDQPRVVSRFGNDREYWEESAKMLGTCLHMMQGTPYIYQGEEIGMTNAVFHSIDEFDDVEAKGAYREYTQNRGMSGEEMIRILNFRSREHARTPMQWDGSENAGFTTGTPWLKVNSNYPKINAKNQVKDESSIFSYYKNLISLRKKHPIIVYGDYTLLLPEDPHLFVYQRSYEGQTLLTLCSFAAEEVEFAFPKAFLDESSRLLISNYGDCPKAEKVTLRPYEARVYLLG